MTTEDLIEALMDKANRNYKAVLRKETPYVARMLDRKAPVTLDGVTYTCWKELTTHCAANFIQEICPNADVEVELDGNDSFIKVELTVEEQQVLNSKLYDVTWSQWNTWRS